MIQKIPENNEQAIDWLYDQYFQLLFEKVYRLVRNTQDTEDIIQELFLSLLEGTRILNVETSLEAYLTTSARNRSIDFLRKKDVLRLSSEANDVSIAHQNILTPEKIMEGSQLENSISEAINQLPPRCREVFVLSRFDEKSYSEIAEQLNISKNTVENQMSKSLKLLRKALKPFLGSILVLSEIFSQSA